MDLLRGVQAHASGSAMGFRTGKGRQCHGKSHGGGDWSGRAAQDGADIGTVQRDTEEFAILLEFDGRLVSSQTSGGFRNIFINKTSLGSPTFAVGFRNHRNEVNTLLTTMRISIEETTFAYSAGGCG